MTTLFIVTAVAITYIVESISSKFTLVEIKALAKEQRTCLLDLFDASVQLK
jgi:hypothetical protein